MTALHLWIIANDVDAVVDAVNETLRDLAADDAVPVDDGWRWTSPEA